MAFLSAEVLILTREPTLVLGISRGISANVIGIPGGHVEPGEEPSTAAARELREETGITLDPHELEPFYANTHRICYIPTRAVKIPPTLQSVPFEGVVAFYTPADMVRWGRHPEHLQILLKKAGVL